MLSAAAGVRKPYAFTLLEPEVAVPTSNNSNNSSNNSYNSSETDGMVPFPPSLYNRENRERMMKWNLDAGLSFFRFKFHERFSPSTDAEAFLTELFADKAVKQVFGAERDPSSVAFKRLSTNVLSMDFFDRLEQRGITVGPEGYIRKCMDEDFNGILVSDRLREMLVNPDSESSDVYSPEEQCEFIYQLFRLLALGGGMCQSDDTVAGYLHVTKTLYKDLMTVQKSNKTGKVEVASTVYRVHKVEVEGFSQGGGDYQLFTRDSTRHNGLYVIVDPARKVATIMRHDWQPFW